ncbi:MAG TPA: VanZ family protein [Thermodesulfobacteriota bacterium]|nr:VanZ family protein [Thermodesulfobacteriota bacterium]
MKILFSFFSLFYIASIFILAGDPLAESLSKYNPFSLLHVPLYGILTLLLVLSMVPIRRNPKDPSTRRGDDSTELGVRERASLGLRLSIAGGIALAVGILDEVHQLYVPGRDASVTDVGLDLVGIAVVLVLFFGLFKTGVLNLKE